VYDDLAEQKAQRKAKAVGGPKHNKARNSQPEAPPRRLSSVSSQLSNVASDFEDDAVSGGIAVKSETLYATAFDSDDEDHDYINNAAARDVPPEYTKLGVGSDVYAPGTIDAAVPTVRPVSPQYVNEKAQAAGGAAPTNRLTRKQSTYNGFDGRVGACNSDDAEIDC
jgi:hypothetical protein